MNTPDVIEELYGLYSDKETSPQIENNRLELVTDLEDGLADLYLEL